MYVGYGAVVGADRCTFNGEEETLSLVHSLILTVRTTRSVVCVTPPQLVCRLFVYLKSLFMRASRATSQKFFFGPVTLHATIVFRYTLLNTLLANIECTTSERASGVEWSGVDGRATNDVPARR